MIEPRATNKINNQYPVRFPRHNLKEKLVLKTNVVPLVPLQVVDSRNGIQMLDDEYFQT